MLCMGYVMVVKCSIAVINVFCSYDFLVQESRRGISFLHTYFNRV